MGWLWESFKGASFGSVCSGAAAFVTGPITSAALNYVGFTAIGPAAGSSAAAWMSSIAVASGGAVPAGCLFSTLQSIAMTGGIVLGPSGVICAGVVGAAAYVVARRPKGSDDRRPGEEKSTSEHMCELSGAEPGHAAPDNSNVDLNVSGNDLTAAGSNVNIIPSAPPLSSEYLPIVADGLCPIDSQPNDTSPNVQLTRRLPDPVDDMAPSNVCVICLDSPTEAVCIPCGHIAGCMKCLSEINRETWDCPVCRTSIDQVIRVYTV